MDKTRSQISSITRQNDFNLASARPDDRFWDPKCGHGSAERDQRCWKIPTQNDCKQQQQYPFGMKRLLILQEFNFFSEATKLFSKYADEHALLFIDRRCLSILGTAKQLIQKPYIEMCKVRHSHKRSLIILTFFQKWIL